MSRPPTTSRAVRRGRIVLVAGLLTALGLGLASGATLRAQEAAPPADKPEIFADPAFPRGFGIARGPVPIRVSIRAGSEPIKGLLRAREREIPVGPIIEREILVPAGSTQQVWLYLRPPMDAERPVWLELWSDEDRAIETRTGEDAADADPSLVTDDDDDDDEEDGDTRPDRAQPTLKRIAATALHFKFREPRRQHVLVISTPGVSVPRDRPKSETGGEGEGETTADLGGFQGGVAASMKEDPPRHVVRLLPEMTPPRFRALLPWNVIVLPSDEISKLPPGALDAIIERARAGATLIVSGGRAPATVLGAPPLADVLPLEVGGSREGDPGGAFSTLFDLPEAAPVGAFRADLVTGTIRDDARVLLASPAGQPMIVARPFGAGEVILVVAPIDQQPLVGKAMAAALWERLLPLPSPVPVDVESLYGSGNVLDAEEQVYKRLVERSPAGSVGGLWLTLALVLYVAAVGPLDYYVVVRKLKRPILTWVSFPLIVGVFAGFGFISAQARMSAGVDGIVAAYVEAGVDGRPTLGMAWVNIASPANRHYRVAVDAPGSSVSPCLAETLASLDATLRDRVEIGPDERESCVAAIRIGTSRTFRADWTMPPTADPLCRLEVERDDGGEPLAVIVHRAVGGPNILAVRVRQSDELWEAVVPGLDKRGAEVAQPDRLRVALDVVHRLRTDEADQLIWNFSFSDEWTQDGRLARWLMATSVGSTQNGNTISWTPSPGLADHGPMPGDQDELHVAVVVDGVSVPVTVDGRALEGRGWTCVRMTVR